MFDAVNQARADKGLKPLKINLTLVGLARQKAKDMIDNSYFAHTSPNLGTAFDQMKKAGVYFTTAGENLAEASSVYSAHYRLLASPTHYANIMSANYTEVGIGVVDRSPSGVMVAQFFIGN